MSLLDSLFGIQRVFINGVELVTRQAVDLTAGAGQVAGVDVPASSPPKSSIRIGFASAAAAPTTGTHARGEIVLNNAPTASGTIGWVCVTAGTPGTWKTWGAISA